MNAPKTHVNITKIEQMWPVKVIILSH